MKRRMLHAGIFYAMAVSALYAIPQADDAWRKHVEATHPVYAPVSKAHLTRGADFIIWQGVSRKLQPCAVIPGTTITLTGHWRDKDGNMNPRAYPAKRPSGGIVEGNPIIRQGDEFVVGPWIIYDEPEAISRMVTVSSFVHCRFSDGVERFAEIGPVDAQ